MAERKGYDILDASRIAFWHRIYQKAMKMTPSDTKSRVESAPDDVISIYEAIKQAAKEHSRLNMNSGEEVVFGLCNFCIFCLK